VSIFFPFPFPKFAALKQEYGMEQFRGILKELIKNANKGTAENIDFIMGKLSTDSSFAMTRYVDFSLSLVKNPEGIKRLEFYLFHGSLIQRNYCSLFFNRRGDWLIVKEAYLKGLIDETQAFAR